MKNSYLFPTLKLAVLSLSVQALNAFADPVVPTASSINNPIKAKTFTELLALILNIIIDVGYPIIILMIILAGFKYVTALGNPGKLKEAHEGFKWVLVGSAIIIAARVIVSIVTNTVAQIK